MSMSAAASQRCLWCGLPAFGCRWGRVERGYVPQELRLPAGNSGDGGGNPSIWTHERSSSCPKRNLRF